MLNNLIAQNLAQGSIINPVLPPTLGQDPDSIGFLQKFLPLVVTLILIVGAIIFFFNLVVGAIQWISSGGDKEAVGKARSRITSALVGLVILFAIFAIIQVVENFFHIQILTLDIGKLIIP